MSLFLLLCLKFSESRKIIIIIKVLKYHKYSENRGLGFSNIVPYTTQLLTDKCDLGCDIVVTDNGGDEKGITVHAKHSDAVTYHDNAATDARDNVEDIVGIVLLMDSVEREQVHNKHKLGDLKQNRCKT